MGTKMSFNALEFLWDINIYFPEYAHFYAFMEQLSAFNNPSSASKQTSKHTNITYVCDQLEKRVFFPCPPIPSL